MNSISSPIKRGVVEARTRKGHSAQASHLHRDSDNFASHHLNVPDLDHTPSLDLLNRLKGRDREALYAELVNLLNEISEELHKKLHESSTGIIFFDHHSGPPSCHPLKHVDKPDILAARSSTFDAWKKDLDPQPSGTSYLRFPWHLVESTVEEKPQRDKAVMQVVAYAGALRQARLDKPGVYALSTRPGGYTVVWDDTEGSVASHETSWDDCGPLIAYVNSLYSPASNHNTVDPNIYLDEKSSTDEKPVWRLKGVDLKFNTVFIGSAHSRMTRINASDDAEELRMWKELHRDEGRRFDEVGVLQKIHDPDMVPGVVQVDFTLSGDVKNDSSAVITTPLREGEADGSQMIKSRLMMLSTGKELMACPTVKDALMVLYDVLEVHRFLVIHRRVLHRDISLKNVYCQPRWTHRPELLLKGKTRPKFIKEVLDYWKPIDARDLTPCCMLADYDNAADLDKVKETMDTVSLRDRTGTPMFIARAVSSGTAGAWSVVPKFPTLRTELNAYKSYIATHGQAFYEKYRVGPDDAPEPPTDDPPPNTVHTARHDAESVYWVLFVFLICALPAKSLKEDTTFERFNSAFWAIHTSEPGTAVDSRLGVMDRHATQVLHPELGILAPFLTAMTKIVKPEYAYLTNNPPEDHLHEAMQRIILEEIYRMETANDPVALKAGETRQPLRPKHSHQESPYPSVYSGIKRRSDAPHAGESASKRR